MEGIALRFHGLPGVRGSRNRGGIPAPGRVAERVRTGSSRGLQNQAGLPYIPTGVYCRMSPLTSGSISVAFILPGGSCVGTPWEPEGPKETRVESR